MTLGFVLKLGVLFRGKSRLGNLELIRNGFAPILIEKDDRRAYFNVLERCQMGGEPGVGNPTEFIAYVERFEERALDRYLRALEISEGIPFDETSRQVGISTCKASDRSGVKRGIKP